MPIQEIKNLLDKILVFESSFKESVLEKAQNLNESKLSELKNILLEVDSWQRKTLENIVKEDPQFTARLVDSRKKAEQEVMGMYRQRLEEEDKKKMEIILNKMESL